MQKGTIHIIEDFSMPQLQRKRTLRIYLPPDYEQSTQRYPVFYMHDAQNLFDVATSAYGAIWDVATILDDFYHRGKNTGMIVVGIDNGQELRLAEYSPWRNDAIAELLPHAKMAEHPGGEGFQYIDFIVQTLKPYIDSHYRTLADRENTAIGGSSMGGVISLCAGLHYQEVFAKIAAFSSAIFFAEKEIKEFIQITGKKFTMKIYMDIGTRETSDPTNEEFPPLYLQTNKDVYEILRSVGFGDEETLFIIDEGAIHNEREWSKRFPSMLEWLFA